MQKAKIVIAVAAALLGVVMFYAIKTINDREPAASMSIQDSLPTPNFGSAANKLFSAAVQETENLNSGITIKRNATLVVAGISTPSPNYVSLLILNHTSESIVFDDIGFGMQVFEFNATSSSWEKVELPYHPQKTPKTLPPNLTTLDFDALNLWELSDKDFVNVKSNAVRIFIFGQGKQSGLLYGAFIDVSLSN